MQLSAKDIEFLVKLKPLVDSGAVDIEVKAIPSKYFVLRGNYGAQIEGKFQMSRQGVRWRFYRLFNLIYVAAYETIFAIEQQFGPSLRHQAMEISKERYLLRKGAEVAWEHGQKSR